VTKVKYTGKVIEVFKTLYGKCSLYANTLVEYLYKGTIIKKILFHIIIISYLLTQSFETSGLHLEILKFFLLCYNSIKKLLLFIVYLYSIDDTFVSMCNRYIILNSIIMLIVTAFDIV